MFASNKSTETYIDPAGYMHTDFNLDADGEYLGLTDANNNIIHEYAPEFQRQVEDVSYGLLSNASSVTLVGPSQTTTALVPTNGALDAPAAGIAPAWTTTAFNDSAWPSSGGGAGVGFDFGDDTLPNVPNGTLLPGGPIGFDLTDADENGTLDGTITAGGFPGSPANEEPPKALDNNEGTKWLAFVPDRHVLPVPLFRRPTARGEWLHDHVGQRRAEPRSVFLDAERLEQRHELDGRRYRAAPRISPRDSRRGSTNSATTPRTNITSSISKPSSASQA